MPLIRGAAVDQEVLTVDEAREIAREEFGDIGDIFDFGEPAHGTAIEQLFAEIGVGLRVDEDAGVIDGKGDDRVHGDTAVADLLGQDVDEIAGGRLAPTICLAPCCIVKYEPLVLIENTWSNCSSVNAVTGVSTSSIPALATTISILPMASILLTVSSAATLSRE